MLSRSSFAVLCLVATALPASAQTANVPFAGLVTASCVLTVGIPGVIAPNATFDQLSSTNSGGLAGTISALATGTNFRVSAAAPSDFTLAPDGASSGVTFSTTYSGSGATSFGSTPGSTQRTLGLGLTNMSVNLAASKSSGVFPGGAYAAEVVVTCE
ncbi:MAG: hypothetical protein NW216_13325 [Hyphomicrobium sp.]|nr:hypothetical protein [Hyphomicrobium sp.]